MRQGSNRLQNAIPENAQQHLHRDPLRSSGRIEGGGELGDIEPVVSPDGKTCEDIAMPDPLLTNICFGGPDLKTACITLSGAGRLIAMEWVRPGLALHFLN